MNSEVVTPQSKTWKDRLILVQCGNTAGYGGKNEHLVFDVQGFQHPAEELGNIPHG